MASDTSIRGLGAVAGPSSEAGPATEQPQAQMQAEAVAALLADCKPLGGDKNQAIFQATLQSDLLTLHQMREQVLALRGYLTAMKEEDIPEEDPDSDDYKDLFTHKYEKLLDQTHSLLRKITVEQKTPKYSRGVNAMMPFLKNVVCGLQNSVTGLRSDFALMKTGRYRLNDCDKTLLLSIRNPDLLAQAGAGAGKGKAPAARDVDEGLGGDSDVDPAFFSDGGDPDNALRAAAAPTLAGRADSIPPPPKIESKIKIVLGGLVFAGFAALILFQGAIWVNAYYMPFLTARGVAVFNIGAIIAGGGMALFGLVGLWWKP